VRPMPNDISETEARLALDSVEERRRQVLAEIDMPAWYWWGLAAGWVVLGVITDLDHPWISAVATLLFGAVHAAVAPRVLSGRHRTQHLSVRADLVNRHLPIVVLGFLIVLAGVTVALSLLAMADDARHPVTIASVVVAVALVCGGPRLVAAARRHGPRHATV
jgi:hypothetical protein